MPLLEGRIIDWLGARRRRTARGRRFARTWSGAALFTAASMNPKEAAMKRRHRPGSLDELLEAVEADGVSGLIRTVARQIGPNQPSFECIQESDNCFQGALTADDAWDCPWTRRAVSWTLVCLRKSNPPSHRSLLHRRRPNLMTTSESGPRCSRPCWCICTVDRRPDRRRHRLGHMTPSGRDSHRMINPASSWRWRTRRR